MPNVFLRVAYHLDRFSCILIMLMRGSHMCTEILSRMKPYILIPEL